MTYKFPIYPMCEAPKYRQNVMTTDMAVGVSRQYQYPPHLGVRWRFNDHIRVPLSLVHGHSSRTKDRKGGGGGKSLISIKTMMLI